MYPSSNQTEQCWVWKSNGQDNYFDKHEWVRVRVEQETWNDVSPVSPAEMDKAVAGGRQCAYSITAAMNETGLGPLIWW